MYVSLIEVLFQDLKGFANTHIYEIYDEIKFSFFGIHLLFAFLLSGISNNCELKDTMKNVREKREARIFLKLNKLFILNALFIFEKLPRSKVGLIQLVMESRESLIRSHLRMPKQDHQRDWWFPLPELANLRVPLNGLIWIISTNCGKSKEMKIIQIYLLFKNKPLQLRRNPLGWDWCRDGYERITMVCLLWVVVV